MYVIYNSANVAIGYTTDEKVAKVAQANDYYMEVLPELTISDVDGDDVSSYAYAQEVLHKMKMIDDIDYPCVFGRSADGTEIRLTFVLGDGWKDETLEHIESVCEQAGYPKRYISACASTTNKNYVY